MLTWRSVSSFNRSLGAGFIRFLKLKHLPLLFGHNPCCMPVVEGSENRNELRTSACAYRYRCGKRAIRTNAFDQASFVILVFKVLKCLRKKYQQSVPDICYCKTMSYAPLWCLKNRPQGEKVPGFFSLHVFSNNLYGYVLVCSVRTA